MLTAPTELIEAATAAGATVIRAPGATIIVIPARAADGDDLLPRAQAAKIAKCSDRTLRAAERAGELTAYGKQRSRCYRRSDLLAWIESRRVRPVAGADDDDLARRMARIARAR